MNEKYNDAPVYMLNIKSVLRASEIFSALELNGIESKIRYREDYISISGKNFYFLLEDEGEISMGVGKKEQRGISIEEALLFANSEEIKKWVD